MYTRDNKPAWEIYWHSIKRHKRKDKIIEHLIEKVTAIRSDRIPSENINMESRVEKEIYDSKEQNVNITQMISKIK